MKVHVQRSGHQGLVVFSPSGGADAKTYRLLGETESTMSVSMDHGGDLVPLMRPVDGRLYRHDRGLLFIANPSNRDPEDPTFFLVKLRALPTAVRFFFEDREGTEFVSVPSDEVIRVAIGARGVTVHVSAASLALPKESLSYALEIGPASSVAPLVRNWPMSERA